MALGWEQAANDFECDLAIVNTCTVTGEADAKNRKLIRSLLRKTGSPVLVTGCAINIDAGHYADIDSRVTCESDKSKIPKLVNALISAGTANASPPHSERVEIGHPFRHFERSEPQTREAEEFHNGLQAQTIAIRASHGDNFRTRVDLKIQDGCNHSCSYCIVHTARGPARSVPASTVLEQASILARHGVQELVLVGIDLAAYREGDIGLATLVTKLQKHTGIGRIRISSVEPQSITPALIEALGQSTGRLCRHLHLCLQSGSSKVLEEMNRHYNAEEFLDLVTRMRKVSPALALSTDVIVGFPGETDEDFEQTCKLVRQCAFMRLHVFRYSRRPGTPAAERVDQIDPRIMAKRSQILQGIGNELAVEDMQRRIGTHEQVIIERSGLGTSESFHTVACDKNLEVGSLVELAFTDLDENKMQLVAH